MRFLQFSLCAIILASVALVSSCEDDIDFAGDHVETPVLFGLLDKSDSLHYVKLTRTFAGSNNSIDVALIDDSSYFQSADIVIEEWATIGNSTSKIRSWVLRDTVLTNKVPGAFYSPNQKVYYFQTKPFNTLTPPDIADPNPTTPLKDGATYKMIATINGGQIVVNGETGLVNSVGITSPSLNSPYAFVKTVNGVKQYSSPSIKGNNGNAKVLDARIQFIFDEYFGTTPVRKSFIWKIGDLIGDQVVGTTSTFSGANGETFYQLVNQNCTNDATITRRKLISMRLILTGGSEDLSKYILVNKPSSSLAQNKPSFTNLSRTDGGPVIGLFSSRMTAKQDKYSTPNVRVLDYLSMKELCTGPISGLKLFCSDFQIDINNNESWACQ